MISLVYSKSTQSCGYFIQYYSDYMKNQLDSNSHNLTDDFLLKKKKKIWIHR